MPINKGLKSRRAKTSARRPIQKPRRRAAPLARTGQGQLRQAANRAMFNRPSKSSTAGGNSKTQSPLIRQLTQKYGTPAVVSSRVLVFQITPDSNETTTTIPFTQLIPLHPMLVGDSLLASRCSTYTRYVWKKLVFQYVPSVTSLASGNTMFAMSSAPVVPKSFEETSRLSFPVMSHISQPVSYTVNAQTEDGSYISNETGDSRHVIDTYLHFLWQGMDGTSHIRQPGSLFLEYSVALFGVRPEPAVPMTRQLQGYYTTASSLSTKTTSYVLPDTATALTNVVSIAVDAPTAAKIAVGDVLTAVGPTSQYGFYQSTVLSTYDSADDTVLVPTSTITCKGASDAAEGAAIAGTAMVVWKVAKIVFAASGAVLNVFGYASWADFFKGKKFVPHASATLVNAYAKSEYVRLTLVLKGAKPEAQEGTFQEATTATE